MRENERDLDQYCDKSPIQAKQKIIQRTSTTQNTTNKLHYTMFVDRLTNVGWSLITVTQLIWLNGYGPPCSSATYFLNY